MNAICKYCKKEIECSNESEESIVARFGPEVISHFDCVLKNMKSPSTQGARELSAKQ